MGIKTDNNATTVGAKVDDHFNTYRGPMAVVRACKYCNHIEKLSVGISGVGRGYGMREGNKARGRMIQHIKSEHADLLKTADSVTINQQARK